MVLTRDELSRALRHEIKILLHLAGKLEPAMLEARWSDADMRAEIAPWGEKTSRGAFLVVFLLSGYAAYRTQLFLYLKACGGDELGTINLWDGIDPPTRS